MTNLLDLDPLLIAEISANHDQSVEQLLKLIELAAATGWNCIKLQTYTADSLTISSEHPSMRVGSEWGEQNLYKLYEKAAMPMEFHEVALDAIRQNQMRSLTSIYDPRDLDFVEKLGFEAYKIASFELTFLDLLKLVAQTNKSIILSTGMANFREIQTAIDTIKTQNEQARIMIMHCVSAYPTAEKDANLQCIETIKREFNCDVGYSDHTEGSRAAVIAYVKGAKAIEKHITNDRTRPGPDHRFSAEPQTLSEIKNGIDEIRNMLGDGILETKDVESINKNLGRRSAFATKLIERGDKISEDNFRFIRPAAGIPADYRGSIIGMIAKTRIEAGSPIRHDDIEK